MDKINRLESAIKENKQKLTLLKAELDVTLTNKCQLVIQQNNLKEQVTKTQRNLQEIKVKHEELISQKIPEAQWLHTRMEIHLENEKYNINKLRKKMDDHIELWNTMYNPPETEQKPEVIKNPSISNTQWSIDSSDTIAAKMEMEAQAAEICLKKTELLESIENEQKRSKMLANRNQAHILKLRKDLQRSEVQRKEVMEECRQLADDVKKIENNQY